MANWTDWINAGGIDLENLTEEIIVEYDAFTGPQTSATYDIDFTDLVYLEVRIDAWANNNTVYYPNAYMYLDSDSNVRWGIGGPNAGSGTGLLINTMGLIGLHTLHFVNPSGSSQHVGHIKVYRSERYSLGNFGSGTVDALPKIISITTTASQEIYTFKEDYECVFVTGQAHGYIASDLCEQIISGTEYASGQWQGVSIFKGVHTGFQIQFGYAGTHTLYVTQTLKKIDSSKVDVQGVFADVEFTAVGDYRTITADLSQYFTDYADLTVEDIVVDLGTSNVIRPNATGGIKVEFTKSYDNSTGILTIASSVDGLAYATHLPLTARVGVLKDKNPITFHYMPAGASNTQHNIFSKNTNTVKCISASGGEVNLYGCTSSTDTSGTLLGPLTTGVSYDISSYDFFEITHGAGITKPDVTIEF